MSQASWDHTVFDRLYAAKEDPWEFRTSAYEQAKYAATIELLPARRFETALEIGCSIGVLTAKLAEHCDRLLAIDCADAALDRAAACCHDVCFERHYVPTSFPAGRFELIVISEVLYFLSREDVATLASCCSEASVIVLANWTGPTDTPCTGEEAADLFIASSQRLSAVATVRAPTFRLDRLEA